LWAWAGVEPATLEPPRPWVRASLATCVVVGCATSAISARDAIRHPGWYFEYGRVYVWGFVVFHAAILAFVALALVCAAVRIATRARGQPSMIEG
jgi:hypothetical protein